MKKTVAIISSLLMLSLGITACSKDGSKKQPNFRNRNKPVSTTAQKSTPGEQRRVITPSSKPGETPSADTTSAADIPVSLQSDKPCELLANATDSLTLDACNAVQVTNLDDVITPLTHYGILHSLNGDQDVLLEKDIQDDGTIIASRKIEQPMNSRNLKVLQIMIDDESVDVEEAMKFQAEPIKTDDNQEGLRDALGQIKIQAGDHLLIVTNHPELIDSATESAAALLKQDLYDNNSAVQAHYTFADSSKLEEAIKTEQAFLNSYVAQLSYVIELDEVDGKKVSKVMMNGEELLETAYKVDRNTSTNRMHIRILDISEFMGPEYTVSVEIVEE